jgi:thioredoxin 1
MANTTFHDLIHGDRPVVVDFYADWCGPCKTMAPIIEQFKAEVGEQAHVLKVDVDRNQQAAAMFGVQSIPTLAIFKDGKIVWRQAGVIGASELRAALRPFL